jgi:hypothetical protein
MNYTDILTRRKGEDIIHNIREEIIPPSKFDNDLTNLTILFNPLLGEFQKYNFFHNKNPDAKEYLRLYDNTKQQLQRVMSNLFMMNNKIQSKIQVNTQNIEKVNNYLDLERKINSTLLKKLNYIQGVTGGSEILNESSKTMNTHYYTLFILLLLGIATALFLMYKFFI